VQPVSHAVAWSLNPRPAHCPPGLASLEVKKRQGHYHLKLLAVDMSGSSAAGASERFFLVGDEQLYRRGNVLSELREPFLKVWVPGAEPALLAR
jgi:hypothetical protein